MLVWQLRCLKHGRKLTLMLFNVCSLEHGCQHRFTHSQGVGYVSGRIWVDFFSLVIHRNTGINDNDRHANEKRSLFKAILKLITQEKMANGTPAQTSDRLCRSDCVSYAAHMNVCDCS